MAITSNLGWLEQPWLVNQWLSGQIEDTQKVQVELVINNVQSINKNQTELRIDKSNTLLGQVAQTINTQKINKAQAELRIDKENSYLSQTEQRIDKQNNYKSQAELRIDKSDSLNSQAELILFPENHIFCQIDQQINDNLKTYMSQTELRVDTFVEFKAQVEQFIIDALKSNGVQIDQKIEDVFGINGAQIFSSNLYWVSCLGWLESPWLTKSWLSKSICGGSRQQVDLRIDTSLNTGSQVELHILDVEDTTKTQVELQIDVLLNLGSQVEAQFTENIQSQILISLYNTTKPRILCEFPSRGVTGENWVASSTQPGDFSILNVNNDISEMYWRSETGIKTSIILTCDTEITQGIFMDTFYVEGHNLTSSAVVVLQGSNDSGFSPVEFDENLFISDNKIFWISPDLPIKSYRYWRLIINDPTNTDDFIKIGLIIFGASQILNSECHTQEIIVTPREFKNALRTEGFTSVGNSRSVKRSIKLDFRQISYDSGDFNTLNDIANYSRTTLKCLWIPDARSRSLLERFSVFGKLTQIPEQRHNVRGIGKNLDHIDMSFEIDEAE